MRGMNQSQWDRFDKTFHWCAVLVTIAGVGSLVALAYLWR